MFDHFICSFVSRTSLLNHTDYNVIHVTDRTCMLLLNTVIFNRYYLGLACENNDEASACYHIQFPTECMEGIIK